MHPDARLATGRSLHLLSRLESGIGTVVAFDPANKAYLSGYHSMAHDVAPAYRSAAILTGRGLWLVTGAADAGPALEVMGDPARIFRYGRFWFRDAAETLDFDTAGYPDFAAALRAALAAAGQDGEIGTDDPALARAVGLQASDIAGSFSKARATKLPDEIHHLRRANAIVEEAITRVRVQSRAGMTEHAIAGMIAEVVVGSGAVPRFISVTSGPRSALADAYPTDRPIASGDLVRMDIGCSFRGYWADVGRTLVVGKATKLQQQRHDAIVAGLHAALSKVRPGTRAADVFHAGVSGTRLAGIPDFDRHHCGHGIGLAGYEFPLIAAESDAVLESGMTLCIETPFYELGWGGMMVEDAIVVTDDGYDSLSRLDHALGVIPG